MRIFSLVALLVFGLVIGYLALHEPAQRGTLDSFAALNVEAAISAANGTTAAAMIFIIARTLLYLVVGVALNLARLRARRAALLVAILALKLVVAWGVYLALFAYARDVGFTRVLWNLQDLGINADATAVIVVSTINIACIALLPDLVVGLLSDKHEVGLVRMGRHRDEDRD
ncbi:MAG: hypothetical protein K8J31_02430 [Anaerolineae bacterium]|nr:hypothetical protein [Anaerolineae bacterium]